MVSMIVEINYEIFRFVLGRVRNVGFVWCIVLNIGCKFL